MRIALACPYAWDAPGGVQVHVRALADHLRRRGHDTLVLAPALDPPRRPRPEPGVVLVGRALRWRYQGTVAPICPDPRSFGRIRTALASFRPDAVHAHEPLSPSTGMYATLAAGVPVVATFHAFAERSRLFDLAGPLVRPVWRRLSVRIAVSRSAAAFVRTRMGEGVRVVPNGVDVEAFGGAQPATDLPPGRRLLWIGRLDAQKGFPVTVRAFRDLADGFPDLALVVIGEGVDGWAPRMLPPDVQGRVAMLGTVPHERLPSYLAAADVFVSSAVGQESFGMVLVEAMAAGVPVVATDIPGYRDVVRDGENGLLVPPHDPAALAAAVGRILRDGDLATALSEGGRKSAERYAWPTVAEEVEGAYRDAMEASRPAHGR